MMLSPNPNFALFAASALFSMAALPTAFAESQDSVVRSYEGPSDAPTAIAPSAPLTLGEVLSSVESVHPILDAARSGKSSREDLVGSTITVTSLGALGGIAATPIINPPEVAIVGVNRMAERPMARDGAVVIAKMMNLSSSFDHRIVDGYAAAAFIKAVKEELEKPSGLELAGA